MTTFIDAMQSRDTLTENGAVAHSTTGSQVLDFFSKSGAMRAQNETEILRAFQLAFREDPTLALRALFYARDIRQGGQGERRLFRLCLTWLADVAPVWLTKNLSLIPKYGRWDDLKVLVDHDVIGSEVIQFWVAEIIQQRDNLAAKWAPRKGRLFFKMAQAAELAWKNWRQCLVHATKVVETKMCAQDWTGINYSQVPSRASMIYRKAFRKHDPTGYDKFIQKALKGEAKIHSGVLYPSDIVGKIVSRYGLTVPKEEDATLQAQWQQLPNYMQDNSRGVLPVCDVSGSMSGEPMNVSVALGLYLSERNHGAFKDVVVTFSDRPAFVKLKARTLAARVQELQGVPWGMNTDLNRTFQVILDRAVMNKVPASEMPELLLIISDMQFDSCASLWGLDMIRQKYARAGYEMPEVVFWNVRASQGQPAKHNEKGVKLVSGYSPGIMKGILGNVGLSSHDLMLDVLNRYDDVQYA